MKIKKIKVRKEIRESMERSVCRKFGFWGNENMVFSFEIGGKIQYAKVDPSDIKKIITYIDLK